MVQAQIAIEEKQEKLSSAQTQAENLKLENAYLSKYVQKIEELEGFKNTGKLLTEVKERQQRRKLKELKNNVEKALWFATTLGLLLKSVCFVDSEGTSHQLNYSGDKLKTYSELPEEDQEQIKTVLSITDKFCVSDASYHELTKTSGGESLPRSYVKRQCKNDLNQLCHIVRTPGAESGAQLNLEDELTSRIEELEVSLIFTSFITFIKVPKIIVQFSLRNTVLIFLKEFGSN